MKIAANFIAILVVIFAISCNNNKTETEVSTPTINIRNRVVNTYLTERFTSIELKGFNVKEIELSDREAYNELFDYYMEKAAHKSRVGRDPKPYFETADSITKYHIANSKGILLFHKIITTKADPDTIHHSVFYFDHRDSLIKATHYK